MRKTRSLFLGMVLTVALLCVLTAAPALADGVLPAADENGVITLTENVTLTADVTLERGQTLNAAGYSITGGGHKITLGEGARVAGNVGNDLYDVLAGQNNYAVVYSDSGSTRSYELSDVICKNYDIYMAGHPAVIEQYGSNPKDLLVSYTYAGGTYYLRYENPDGCAAVVYGGVKDIAEEDLDTSLTLKSGQLAAMVAGSKVNNAAGSVRNAVINIEGGSVVGDAKCTSQPYASQGMVMAVWYWGPDVESFTFNMTGGEVSGQVFGGAATSTSAGDTAVTVDSFTANVSGGSIDGDLFAGADELTRQEGSTQTVKSAKINISGSASVTNVFGGGFANWNGALCVVEKSEINLNGGTVDTIYGGGQNGLETAYNNSATSRVDEVTVNINGGEVTYVYGGGYNFHWVNSYWVDDSGNVIKVDYEDVPISGEMVHYSNVVKSTINVNGGDISGEVTLGGRSWAHVGTSEANISADVPSVSGLGNFGYVENSCITVNPGASVGTLDLVRSGIVGNSSVYNNGSIGTLIAGAPANRYVNNMGVNKIGVLGDVVISGSGTVDKAQLTYGLELASNVSSSVPLELTAVPFGPVKDGASNTMRPKENSDWSGATVVLSAGTTFKAATGDGSVDPTVQLGDGTVVTPDDNGVYSGKAARVGNTYYNTLADAAAAANGQTVVLMSDIVDQELIEVKNGMKLTIDLNGFDIGFAENSYFKVDGGSLNLSGSGRVYEQKPYDAPIKIWGSPTDVADYSNVTVGEDVVLEGWAGVFITVAYDVNDKAHAFGVNVTMNGTINSVLDKNSDAGHGVYINGMNNDITGNVPRITLGASSKISSVGTGVYAAGYAIWNMAGDISAEQALSLKSGTFNITGGTYHSIGSFADPPEADSNGDEMTGAALSITSNDDYAKKLVVNVSGGAFISDNGYAVYEGIAKTTGGQEPAAAESYAVISITGGSFTGNSEKGAVRIAEAEDKNVISGGSFSSPVREYLDKTVKYELESGSGESFSYFGSLSQAQAAARPGDSIEAVNVQPGVSTFDVTLKFNDNATPDLSYTLEQGTQLTLPAPTRAGYEFAGWSDGRNLYEGGKTYTVSADATLTARWRLITSGGGTGIMSYPISVADGIMNGTIKLSASRASQGAVVNITPVPDAGYVLDSLTVTDAAGAALSLTEKGGVYSFTMPDSAVRVDAVFVKAGDAPFADVSVGDYYYDAVLWAVANGITNGTGAYSFSPDLPVTRAQMVTFLWRAAGSPKAAGVSPFSDVPVGSYYYDAVLWAVANGITDGTSADTFSPDQTVTRAQAVTFQWRAAGSPKAAGAGFSDVPAGEYYYDAVLWAVANGITNGTGADTFSPGQPVTRAQAVTFLYRALA